MRAEDTFSMQRLRAAFAMVAGLLGVSVFWSLWHHFTIDRLLLLLFLQLLFFPVFFVFLEMERKEGGMLKNRTSSYRMFCRGFLAALVLYVIFSFLPSYAAPVLLPAVFLTLVSNPAAGMVGSLYLDLLLTLASGCSYFELASYLLLSVFGCLLAGMLKQKSYRIYMDIIIFSVSVSIPGLFYFLSDYTIDARIFLSGGLGGLLTDVVVFFLYDRIAGLAETENERTLQEIIAPEYPLVKDIQNYSQIDYMHAVHVSKTSYQCALQIGADADVAAAAGFYYRLGRLEGEPFIDNGVLLAGQNCFPAQVTEILSEYNGEQNLPSTRESAIVHMVDAVIAKFELLDKDTLTNTWNHDMVIYQTLNEKSSAGIYDESGLSMNQYLKIREYLVKGVKLF